MQHLGWLNTVLTVFALASAAGFGLQITNLRNVRDAAKDLRDEVGDKDRRIVEKDRLLAEAAKQIELLEGDKRTLSRTVTGEAYLVALEQKFDEHHHEAKSHWASNDTLLREIRDEIRKGNGHAR